VFDRVELADLYPLKLLHSSCRQLIRSNLKMLKKETKWLELKEKARELAFSILEDFAEENRNVIQSIEQEFINRFAAKLGYKKLATRHLRFMDPFLHDFLSINWT
jgi:hypothetical protein